MLIFEKNKYLSNIKFVNRIKLNREITRRQLIFSGHECSQLVMKFEG